MLSIVFTGVTALLISFHLNAAADTATATRPSWGDLPQAQQSEINLFMRKSAKDGYIKEDAFNQLSPETRSLVSKWGYAHPQCKRNLALQFHRKKSFFMRIMDSRLLRLPLMIQPTEIDQQIKTFVGMLKLG